MNPFQLHACLAEAFRNVERHRDAANLIREHSVNRRNIREVALDAVNLGGCRQVLDLGSGFGPFIDVLKGRLAPGTRVTGVDVFGDYGAPFLAACREAGLQGTFLKDGASVIETFPARAFDLIVCSYSLYFFPERVPDISRTLRDAGTFIAITHDRNNMRELILAVKAILAELGHPPDDPLPVENILGRFTAENGRALLAPWFGEIRAIDYPNALVFEAEGQPQLLRYFRFKSPFFLHGTAFTTETVARHLEARLRPRNRFVLSKNDRIFLCSSPRPENASRRTGTGDPSGATQAPV